MTEMTGLAIHHFHSRVNDALSDQVDADRLDANEGAETLFGDVGRGLDAEYIDGDGPQGSGWDTPYAEHGNDVLVGGAGNDSLRGQGGSDELYGGDDDDRLFGDTARLSDTPLSIHGEDYLDGGAGADQLTGSGRGDVLYGGARADVIAGGQGDDDISGDGDLGAVTVDWGITRSVEHADDPGPGGPISVDLYKWAYAGMYGAPQAASVDDGDVIEGGAELAARWTISASNPTFGLIRTAAPLEAFLLRSIA